MSTFVQHIRQWMQDRRARRVSYDYARTRVRRGAAYLDDVDPEWYRQIDPETLELSSGSSCVLGQLHGDFRMGLSRSQLINMSSAPRTSLSPVSYGFKCIEGVGDAVQERDYRYLNRAWRAAVLRRKAADADSRIVESEPSDRSPAPGEREGRPSHPAETR